MNVEKIPFFPLAICFLLLTGCGYQIAGRGGHIQSEIQTIAIPVFKNDTMEPIVEEELTPAVIREFIKDSRVEVVDRSRSDLVLLGSVTSYKETPLAFDRNQNALEYRITVTAHLKLLHQRNDQVLWERDVTENAEYGVSSDVMATRTAKLLALQEIGKNIAENATDRVLWEW